MTRQKLSQRPRHVSPTRPRSRTMCSTPAAASSWLSERPACPAPTMTTSTFEFIDADCRRAYARERTLQFVLKAVGPSHWGPVQSATHIQILIGAHALICYDAKMRKVRTTVTLD